MTKPRKRGAISRLQRQGASYIEAAGLIDKHGKGAGKAWTAMSRLKKGFASPWDMALASLVGELIREHRDDKGWSQEELAQRAGIGTATLCHQEAGQNNGNILSIMKVAKALGIEAEELLPTHATVERRAGVGEDAEA